MRNEHFLEGNEIVQGFAPVDMQTADNEGDYIDLANAEKVIVHLVAAIGTAGDDPIIQLKQATSAAGAGEKDLNFTKLRYKVGATLLSAVNKWVEVTQTAAASYDSDPINGAENELQLAIEVTPAMLDVNNGFTWLKARVLDVGGNAQLGYLEYIIQGRSYKRAIPDGVIA